MTERDTENDSLWKEGHPAERERVLYPDQYAISTLAWIGDAVFELYVRLRLAENGRLAGSGALHKTAITFVSAHGQSLLMDKLLQAEQNGLILLDDREHNLLRRARNYHTESTPKNADIRDYRIATAFEALIGWLWVSGNRDRADTLIRFVLKDLRPDSSGKE